MHFLFVTEVLLCRYCVLQHVMCKAVCSVMDSVVIIEKYFVFLTSKNVLALSVVVTWFFCQCIFSVLWDFLMFYSCLLFLKTG